MVWVCAACVVVVKGHSVRVEGSVWISGVHCDGVGCRPGIPTSRHDCGRWIFEHLCFGSFEYIFQIAGITHYELNVIFVVTEVYQEGAKLAHVRGY